MTAPQPIDPEGIPVERAIILRDAARCVLGVALGIIRDLPEARTLAGEIERQIQALDLARAPQQPSPPDLRAATYASRLNLQSAAQVAFSVRHCETFPQALREIVARLYGPTDIQLEPGTVFDFYRDEEAKCYRVQAWVTVPFSEISPCPPPHQWDRCPEWPPGDNTGN
jgi:hypothetical protein